MTVSVGNYKAMFQQKPRAFQMLEMVLNGRVDGRVQERERERVKAETSVSTQQAQMRRWAGMWPPSSGISGAGELGSAALFIWPDLAFATRLQQPVAERIFCPPAEICYKYLP